MKGLCMIYNTLVRWVSRQADPCQVGYQGTDLTLRFLLTAKEDLQCWSNYPDLWRTLFLYYFFISLCTEKSAGIFLEKQFTTLNNPSHLVFQVFALWNSWVTKEKLNFYLCQLLSCQIRTSKMTLLVMLVVHSWFSFSLQLWPFCAYMKEQN